MTLQKKHRVSLTGALPALYDQGAKTLFKNVPVGSLVLVRFDDEDVFDPDDGAEYQLLIVYAQNATTVRCAEPYSLYRLGQTTGVQLGHKDECVIMSVNLDLTQSALIYYQVTVESVTHQLRGTANVLAVSTEQAKELAGAITVRNIQSFLDGPVHFPNPNSRQIDAAHFLKDAIYTVKVLADQPAVIKSEWDKVK